MTGFSSLLECDSNAPDARLAYAGEYRLLTGGAIPEKFNKNIHCRKPAPEGRQFQSELLLKSGNTR